MSNQFRSTASNGLRMIFSKQGLKWKVLAGIIIVAGLFFVLRSGDDVSANATTFAARRGNLDITVIEGGQIAALESQEIKCEVKGQTKILTIVEEGYLVSEDDVKSDKVLVTLDNSDILERATSEEMEYQSAAANFTDAREQYEIQIKQNESDIRAAELEVKFGRMDFEKYVGEELAKEIIDKIMAAREVAEKSTMDILGASDVEEPEVQEAQLEEVNAQLGNDIDVTAPGDEATAETEKTEVASAGKESTEQGSPSPGGRGNGEGRPGDRQRSADRSGEGRGGEGRGNRPDGAAGGRAAGAEAQNTEKPAGVDAAAENNSDFEEIDTMALSASAERFQLAMTMASQARPVIDFKAYADPKLLGDGEAQQKLRQVQNERLLNEEELALSRTTLEGSRRLAEKSFITKQELETDEMKVRRGEISSEASQTSLDLFITYEFPKEAEKLLSAFEEAMNKLDRTRKESISKLAQAEAKLKSAEARYKLQGERLRDLKEQLVNCVITAERPGLVVYAGSNDPWRNREQIQEGAQVFEHQEIITIPDMTKMGVEVSVHESAVKKVAKGQRARIVLDAFPDQPLEGEVVQVSVLPDSSRRWMNPELKVYKTRIGIKGVHDWLKPGLSAKVEMFVETLNDVVYVPLQAVSPVENGKRVVYVDRLAGSPQRREVETGQYNEKFIEIVSGLEEGERVLLRTPDGVQKPKDADGQGEDEQQPAEIPASEQVAQKETSRKPA